MAEVDDSMIAKMNVADATPRCQRPNVLLMQIDTLQQDSLDLKSLLATLCDEGNRETLRSGEGLQSLLDVIDMFTEKYKSRHGDVPRYPGEPKDEVMKRW